MKVALIHDWVTNFSGAEQVLLALYEIYPQAPIFTSVYNSKKVPQFKHTKIVTSFLQNFPPSKNKHQLVIPFMPFAFEQFDLKDYDVVISSSHSCSKGVLTSPETLHICYCYTPTRYLWEIGIDKRVTGKVIKGFVGNYLRVWDRLAACRVDYFIAISETVKRRIKKYYGRGSEIIYPPVNTGFYKPQKKIGDWFLIVSRLIPYKKVDIAVQAFSDLGLPLVVIGEGPELEKLKKMAKPNIKFLGRLEDEQVKKYYSQCKAFIFPGEEDFGITPVEAMASGRPVIAYKKGGACESVIEGITGTFFKEQTPQCLIEIIRKFKPEKYNPQLIRQHALKFDRVVFKKKIKEFVDQKYRGFKKN
jgi:glycosyltransferase involved in cell wall biosynthesis